MPETLFNPSPTARPRAAPRCADRALTTDGRFWHSWIPQMARPSPRSGETVFWPPETKGPELSLKRSFSNRDCKTVMTPLSAAHYVVYIVNSSARPFLLRITAVEDLPPTPRVASRDRADAWRRRLRDRDHKPPCYQ